jgi:hypothetical protein
MKRAYIEEQTYEKISTVYAGKQQGLERIIDNFILLRRFALANLRDVFTQEEKNGMLSAFNGTIIPTGWGPTPKSLLRGQMEDAEIYDGGSTAYSYQLPELLEKLDNLTEADSLFLLEEIHRYWNEAPFTEMRDLTTFLTADWK